MNIDLLMTSSGAAGIVTDQPLEHPVTTVLLDPIAGIMNLETDDLDSIEMNIPVSEEFLSSLCYTPVLQFGVIHNRAVQDARAVELMLLSEPTFGPPPHFQGGGRVKSSVMAFESFLKNAVTGQPLYRDDLGDEDSLEGVMAGLDKAVLDFAPHLARQRNMEAAPRVAPSVPGLGLGGSGGGGGHRGGSHTSGGGNGQAGRGGNRDEWGEDD